MQTERSAVFEYHQLMSLSVDELVSNGAQLILLNEEEQEGKQVPRYKRLLLVPVSLAANASASYHALLNLSDSIKQAFGKKVFRAINPPAFFTDVSHCSLSIHPAFSVTSPDAEYIQHSMRQIQRYILHHHDAASAQLLAQVERILSIRPDELRRVQATGNSYKAYVYTDNGERSKIDINHLAILVSPHDSLPLVYEQRLRKSRNDQRQLILSFPGGFIENSDPKTKQRKPYIEISPISLFQVKQRF